MSPTSIAERVAKLEIQSELNHAETRKDIKELKMSQETINRKLDGVKDGVHTLKIQITTWGTVAGVITAIAIKLIDHIWK